ncbi:hypothetical protein AQ616_15785 [Oceanobacillus sp. E9]|nr:hypothetical protein AQ616_15785 [Oceanobacillus sp. E9]
MKKYKMMKGKYLEFIKRMVRFYLLTLIIALFSNMIEWFPTFIEEICLVVGTISFIVLLFALKP